MKYIRAKHLYIPALLAASIIIMANTGLAQPFQEQPFREAYHGNLNAVDRNFLFHLLTGGYGAFIITFFGIGGVGSLFLTRGGDSSKKTPMLGVIMLLLAGMTFAYRVAIRAGLLGHEYIQW